MAIKMSSQSRIDRFAESLRREPFHPLPIKYSCVGKAFRLKRACRHIGVQAKVVICIGYVEARVNGHRIRSLTIHGWCDIAGKRIEVAHPEGVANRWGIADMDIKPVIGIWI